MPKDFTALARLLRLNPYSLSYVQKAFTVRLS